MAATPVPAVQDGRSIIMTAIAELDKVFQPTSQAAECSQSARSARRKAAVQVSTPALMSVLPPSRKRQRLSWLAEEQLKQVRKPEQAYRPLSRQDLIGRIATFTLTLWDDRKPEGCTAVDFARDGWRCTGKKRGEVTCDVCKAVWHVSATADSVMGGEALQRDMRENHSKSCPWRYDSCPSEKKQLFLLWCKG